MSTHEIEAVYIANRQPDSEPEAIAIPPALLEKWPDGFAAIPDFVQGALADNWMLYCYCVGYMDHNEPRECPVLAYSTNEAGDVETYFGLYMDQLPPRCNVLLKVAWYGSGEAI